MPHPKLQYNYAFVEFVVMRSICWLMELQRICSLIPNEHQLIPKFQHPHHDLFEKMLLEPAGVCTVGNETQVKIGHSCWEELKKPSGLDVGSISQPPKFSLTNNLWIGRIPWCLQVLTFPEELLLAQLYPWVYFFKLFPKRGGHSLEEGVMLQPNFSYVHWPGGFGKEIDQDHISSLSPSNMWCTALVEEA